MTGFFSPSFISFCLIKTKCQSGDGENWWCGPYSGWGIFTIAVPILHNLSLMLFAIFPQKFIAIAYRLRRIIGEPFASHSLRDSVVSLAQKEAASAQRRATAPKFQWLFYEVENHWAINRNVHFLKLVRFRIDAITPLIDGTPFQTFVRDWLNGHRWPFEMGDHSTVHSSTSITIDRHLVNCQMLSALIKAIVTSRGRLRER